jgi:hypothetical protein
LNLKSEKRFVIKMNLSEEVVVEGGLVNEKALPKDAQIMVSILRDIGITEFEPRVINQV